MITEDRSAALSTLVSMVEPYSEPPLGTPGVYQSILTKVDGLITQSGDVSIVVTANGMANSPKTLSVPVVEDDESYDIAEVIRVELNDDPDVSGFFSISGAGVNVILTSKAYSPNDVTMNMALDNDTSLGLTPVPTSTPISAGSVPNFTELEAILDDNLLSSTWAASTEYAIGQYVLPSIRNGHRYIVEIAGTSGSTEPSQWSTSANGKVIDGSVTFREDGVESGVGYDLDRAAWDAWNKKSAKASEFISTPGVDMGKIYDRCIKMRDSFDSVMVA